MKKEKSPLLYNFGMGGADLFRELICLRRLVADGFKPQRVGIEITPIALAKTVSAFVTDETVVARARSSEFEVYTRYGGDPKFVRGIWYESRLDPVYKFGMRAQYQTLSRLQLLPIPVLRHWDDAHAYDEWGWYKGRESTTAEVAERGLEHMRDVFGQDLKNFSVSETNIRALTEILDLCREQKIEAFLLCMPESKEFQALYPQQAKEATRVFIEEFRSKYGLKFIDARSWLDSDKFADGQHLLAVGAGDFTRLLAREIEKEFPPGPPAGAK